MEDSHSTGLCTCYLGRLQEKFQQLFSDLDQVRQKISIEFLQQSLIKIFTTNVATQNTGDSLDYSIFKTCFCFISNSLDTIRTSRHSQTSLHLHVFRMNFRQQYVQRQQPPQTPTELLRGEGFNSLSFRSVKPQTQQCSFLAN